MSLIVNLSLSTMRRLSAPFLLFGPFEITLFDSIVRAFFRFPLDFGVGYSLLKTLVFSLIVKREPMLSSDYSCIEPPISSMIILEIHSPSPVPP